MIPISLQPEPPGFDKAVRRKGHQWLKKQGIALNNPPPKASDLPPYWRNYNQHLWQAYSGVCAYLAIYFEQAIGATSTDHFVPKSAKAGDAYEWQNYRLSCPTMNRNKHGFSDVLDPVGLKPKHTFYINFASGKIAPAPNLPPPQKSAATKTIARLRLNSPVNNEMRARHYTDYAKGDCSLCHLASYSPFVHQEIVRQEL